MMIGRFLGYHWMDFQRFEFTKDQKQQLRLDAVFFSGFRGRWLMTICHSNQSFLEINRFIFISLEPEWNLDDMNTSIHISLTSTDLIVASLTDAQVASAFGEIDETLIPEKVHLATPAIGIGWFASMAFDLPNMTGTFIHVTCWKRAVLYIAAMLLEGIYVGSWAWFHRRSLTSLGFVWDLVKMLPISKFGEAICHPKNRGGSLWKSNPQARWHGTCLSQRMWLQRRHKNAQVESVPRNTKWNRETMIQLYTTSEFPILQSGLDEIVFS